MMPATLEGLDVGITFTVASSFDTPNAVLPQNVQVTVGPGNELEFDIEARIMSDTDGDGDSEPVQGPNGLFAGTVTVDISGNEVRASFSGQAQPGQFTIEISNLRPAGYAPGTFEGTGGMQGVNQIFDPQYDAGTGTLELTWSFSGFQPGTVLSQTVLYNNELADAPVATDDSFGTFVGTSVAGNVLSNDSDLDNSTSFGVVDPLRVSAVAGDSANVGQWTDLTGGGRVLINADGTLSFDDNGDFDDLPRDTTDSVTVEYTVSDSADLFDTGQVTFTVTGVNTDPVISAPPAVAGVENASAAIGGISIADADGDTQTVTLAVNGGALTLGTLAGLAFSSGDGSADATMSFTGSVADINAALGSLSYLPGANFAGSAALNITSDDGQGGQVTDSVTINVADVDPELSATTFSVAENALTGSAVGTVTATGDTNGLTYSIVSGNDGGAFDINATSGAITVADPAALNFESGTTSFALEIGVDDEDGDHQADSVATATISVTDLDEDPVITSSTSFIVDENETIVGSASATDPEGAALTYAFSGGADASLFSIDADTGEVSFVAAPNFEAPADAGGNNVYEVEIVATDETANTSQTQQVSITVADANEAPEITSSDSFSIGENTAAVGTLSGEDEDGDALIYSIVGGADAALFAINGSSIGFISAPDFDMPSDQDGDNSYELEVQASDGQASSSPQSITIAVTDIDEMPGITSSAGFAIAENQFLVGAVAATDPEGAAVTYSIHGGADASAFSIDGTTGELSFVTAPDFEVPSDTGGDNVYLVEVQAVSSSGQDAATQLISITVGDQLDETAPVVTVNASSTTDRSPPLSGTIDDATATIFVTVNGQTVSALNNGDGTWFVVDDDLGVLQPGTYDVAVEARDAAGNVGSDSSTNELKITNPGGGENPGIFVPPQDASSRVVGTSGDDQVFAGGGDDTVQGGGGDDVIGGGIGSDIIYGGDGNDQLFGGPDDGADKLYGGAGSDEIWAGNGNDQSYGGAGNDVIGVGGGDDVVGGGLGNDQIYAGAGNDLVFGGAGDDSLFGGAGDDVLWAGTGNNRLSGGDGADVFGFVPGTGASVVTDFEQGTDQIDLSSFGLASFDELDFTTSGDAVIISLGGITITIESAGALSAQDVIL